MKNYEIIVLINPDLSDSETDTSIQKIKDLILSEKGEISKSTDSIKKSLGYKIKGKKEALIVSFIVSLLPEKVAILIEKFKKENVILRPIITEIKKHKAVREPRTPKSKKFFNKLSNDSNIFEIEEKELEHKPEAKKVEMKEIDQKIEEILNE